VAMRASVALVGLMGLGCSVVACLQNGGEFVVSGLAVAFIGLRVCVDSVGFFDPLPNSLSLTSASSLKRGILKRRNG